MPEKLTTKGKKTRENIMNTAKTLFYHRGYNNTGIQDIAAEADVKLGTMTYYFKKKTDLVGEIFNTYFMRLYDRVGEEIGQEATLFTKYCFTQVCLFDAILKDPNNARFYYEIMQKDASRKERLYLIKTFNRSSLDFFNKSYSEADLNAYAIINYGAQKELFIDYYDRELPYTAEEMVSYLVRNTFRVLAIDKESLDNTMKQAFEFLKTSTVGEIPFLI
ncbi:MAG: TetR/AcrR family transcriptional regulator [Eubacterium sp.]|nr:TetR/AcrR family transcriptional regulator [Eubacterium sp.]